MEEVHAISSPEAVVHLVPDEKKAKKAVCEAHELRVGYLNYHIQGHKQYASDHQGWQAESEPRGHAIESEPTQAPENLDSAPARGCPHHLREPFCYKAGESAENAGLGLGPE